MNIYKMPWQLVQNKLDRYPGGRELDRFRAFTRGRMTIVRRPGSVRT